MLVMNFCCMSSPSHLSKHVDCATFNKALGAQSGASFSNRPIHFNNLAKLKTIYHCRNIIQKRSNFTSSVFSEFQKLYQSQRLCAKENVFASHLQQVFLKKASLANFLTTKLNPAYTQNQPNP